MLNVPQPRPYDERSSEAIPWHTTLLGNYMQHNFWIYSIIDRVMMNNPQIQSIVEIGTGSGCVTTIFGLWGIHRNIPVISIDNTKRHHNHVLKHLGVEFLQVDETLPSTQEIILERISNKPTWLYCDGGCKSRELNQFAPLIAKDSIISAHDLGVEFQHHIDAINLCNDGVIQPYKTEWWMEFNIQLALYIKL
jgi:hypothetical protein